MSTPQNPQPAGDLRVAVQLLAAGRPREAADICQKVLLTNAAHIDALKFLAFAAVQEQRFDLAAETLERLIVLRPDDVDALCDLGAAYGKLGDSERALDRLLRVQRLRPDLPSVHVNLSNAWRTVGDLPQAVASSRKAIELVPDSALAHLNLANALSDLGEFTQAIEHYNQALRLQPDYAAAHKNLGLVLLRCGDFELGLQKYESRFQADGLPRPQDRFTQPLWHPSLPAGQTVLLWGEQGFGDKIQFVRYATRLSQWGADVVLQIDDKLKRLFSQIRGIGRVVGFSDPTPLFVAHAPLLSLPHLFKTTVDTIPSADRYLRAEPDRINAWRERLSHLPGLRIGLSWQGSQAYMGNRFRSIPLAAFQPLTELAGVSFVSLQKGDTASQLAGCGFAERILNLADELDQGPDAFVDTAAVIENLDLVISCDSALAHLAGALGRPVWVLLRYVAHWPWLLNRSDSPWYPSARLFRQQHRDDWPGVLAVVTRSLSEQLARR